MENGGEPIPEEARDHIFLPYHRLGGARTQPASVGLGLTVARTLAELMRGSLEYRWESERHVFDLRLPIGGARHHEQIAS